MRSKRWEFGRKVRPTLVALLTVVFVVGSLFYVAAQRGNHSIFNGEPDSQPGMSGLPSLNALPNPNGGLTAVSSSYFQTLYCASDDGRRNFCAADTRGGVRLVRQRSGSPCIQGRTWGFDRRGIWVDRGCRADFEADDRGRDRDRDNGRGRDRDRDYDRGRGRGGVQSFYCESGDGRRHYCSEGERGSVRLVRQRSNSPCIQGRTWGRDASGFYVDRGCRADFEVRR